MKNLHIKLVLSLGILGFIAQPGFSKEFKYRSAVSLKVGQSIIIKGVRDNDCGKRAPSWSHIKRGLPKSKLGVFKNGGAGTTASNSCGGVVGARGIMFQAKKAGTENLRVYEDRVKITVTGG